MYIVDQMTFDLSIWALGPCIALYMYEYRNLRVVVFSKSPVCSSDLNFHSCSSIREFRVHPLKCFVYSKVSLDKLPPSRVWH